ncbi:DUF4270 family protein [Halocola ammonii]
MTYRIFKGQRPVLAALFFLTALTTVLSSCEKPENEVGIGVQPEEDNIDLTTTDTTTLQMVTEGVEPVRTDESSIFGSLIGNYVDPIFGSVKTSTYTQLRLSTNNVDFGDVSNIVVDSVVMELLLTGEMYGDIVPQDFVVERVTEPLSIDSSYTTESQLAVTGNNLIDPNWITQTVDTADTEVVDDQTLIRVRFHLTNELAQVLLDASGTEDLQNNENFIQFFNGIRISSNSEAANTFEISPTSTRSSITMHYRDLGDEEPETELEFELLINSNCAYFTNVEFDYSGTDLQPLQNGQDSISGAERLYIQSQGGVRTKISFPNLMDYADPSTRIINRAELVIPLEEGTEEPYFPIIKVVPLTDYNDGEDQLPIRDFFAPTGAQYVNMLYDTTKHEYRFNITRHIQGVFEGTVENSVIYLEAEHPRFGTTSPRSSVPFDVRRSVINGLEDEENRPRLVLTYTD